MRITKLNLQEHRVRKLLGPKFKITPILYEVLVSKLFHEFEILSGSAQFLWRDWNTLSSLIVLIGGYDYLWLLE